MTQADAAAASAPRLVQDQRARIEDYVAQHTRLSVMRGDWDRQLADARSAADDAAREVRIFQRYQG